MATHNDKNMQNTLPAQLHTAHVCLDTPPPPTLRDILQSYKRGGDGDRELLLSMLNAKTAEDQRLASLANLHKTMLEIYQISSQAYASPSPFTHAPYEYPSPEAPSRRYDGRPLHPEDYHRHAVNYPTPSISQSPPHEAPSSRGKRDRNYETRQWSQHTTYVNGNASHRGDAYDEYDRRSLTPHSHYSSGHAASHSREQPARKRQRMSPDTGSHSRSPREDRQTIPQPLPLSPHSSQFSGSDPDYSPRSRGSMTIDSLVHGQEKVNGHLPASEGGREVEDKDAPPKAK